VPQSDQRVRYAAQMLIRPADAPPARTADLEGMLKSTPLHLRAYCSATFDQRLLGVAPADQVRENKSTPVFSGHHHTGPSSKTVPH